MMQVSGHASHERDREQRKRQRARAPPGGEHHDGDGEEQGGEFHCRSRFEERHSRTGRAVLVILRTWVAEMRAYQRAWWCRSLGWALRALGSIIAAAAYGLGEARKLRRARGPGAIGRMEWKSV